MSVKPYSSLRSNFLVGMMGLSISSRLIVSGRHPLFWVVLVLCLALLKVLFCRCLGAKEV